MSVFDPDQPAGDPSTAPIGTTSAKTPFLGARVLIAGLPSGMSQDTLLSMLVWAAQDILNAKLEQGPIPDSLMKAHVDVKSIDTGTSIHRRLHGHLNTAKTGVMTVNVFQPGGLVHVAASASKQVFPTSFNAATTGSASTYGGTIPTGSLPQSCFNIDSELDELGSISNHIQSSDNDFDGSLDWGRARDDEAHPHSIVGFTGLSTAFGWQSFHSQNPRVSDPSSINKNVNIDDMSKRLTRDRAAFAQSGSSAPRSRALTQVPIEAMNSWGLNTNISTQKVLSASSSSNAPRVDQVSLSDKSHAQYVSENNSHQLGPDMWNNKCYLQQRQMTPAIHPADQNPPCNTLYVGNLPLQANEVELKAIFSKQRGYKRLCFRITKNAPLCFVEFEDISFATKALKELYGYPLHNSTKGGIRLSFSKNPLGVRSQHHSYQASMEGLNSFHGASCGAVNGCQIISGPPYGLYNPSTLSTTGQRTAGNHPFQQQSYGPTSTLIGSGRYHPHKGGQTIPIGMTGLNGSPLSKEMESYRTHFPVGPNLDKAPLSSAGMSGVDSLTGYLSSRRTVNMPQYMLRR